MRQYATVSEYEASPLTTGTTTDQVLVAASLEVDRMLTTSIYDVDDQGLPTDPDITTAIRNATIAQAQYAATVGDPAGIGAGRITTARIGSIQYSRAGVSGQGAPGRGSPQAEQILRSAGLLGHGVQAAGIPPLEIET